MTDLDRILHDLAEQGSRAAGQADPTEIRRAGDARRLRRLVGGVVAIALVVAAVVATTVVVAMFPSDGTIPVTPAIRQPSASPTPERHTLADDPLLDGPLRWQGAYDGLDRTDNKAEFMPDCMPPLDDLGATVLQTANYFGDLDASVNSGALEFGTVAEAEMAVADLIEPPESCDQEIYDRDTTVHEPRERDAGDESYVFAQESFPNENNPGSSTSYFSYGVVRDANIVVVIEYGAMSMPVQGKPYATWTTDRLDEMIMKAVKS